MTDYIALARVCGAYVSHSTIGGDPKNRRLGYSFDADQLSAFAARIAEAATVEHDREGAKQAATPVPDDDEIRIAIVRARNINYVDVTSEDISLWKASKPTHPAAQPMPTAPTYFEPESLARRFHETYERLAPSFGYVTRPDTKQFDPDSANGRLMTAVCAEVFAQAAPTWPAAQPMTLNLIQANGGFCVSLNDYRIAGPKPWGGGKVIKRWTLSMSDIESALGIAPQARGEQK